MRADIQQEGNEINVKFEALNVRQTRLSTKVDHIAKDCESLKAAKQMVEGSISSVEQRVDELIEGYNPLADKMEQLTREVGSLKVEQKNSNIELQEIKKQMQGDECDSSTSGHRNCREEVEKWVSEKGEQILREIKREVGSMTRQIYGENTPAQSSTLTSNTVPPGHNLVNEHRESVSFTRSQTTPPIFQHINMQQSHGSPLEHLTMPTQSNGPRTNTVPGLSTVVTHTQSAKNGDQVINIVIEDGLGGSRKFPTFSEENKKSHPIIFLQTFRNVLPHSWSDARKIQEIVSHIEGNAKPMLNLSRSSLQDFGHSLYKNVYDCKFLVRSRITDARAAYVNISKNI